MTTEPEQTDEQPSNLKEVLSVLQELGPQAGLEKFASSLDPIWIEEALIATGTASIRRRKLPAELAVWVLIGMCLFADRSIVAVVDHLRLVLPGVKKLAASAIPKARQRLGYEPLRHLFEKVVTAWGETPGLGGYRGMSLYGIDGTHLRVQDSDQNFEYFGKPGGRGGSNDAGYPQARVVALMNLSNRLVTAAEFGPWSAGEPTLLKPLLGKIPDRSLTIVDRGLYSYKYISEIVTSGSQRHAMARIRKDISCEILEVLPDGSALVRVRPSKMLLAAEPEVPEELTLRVIEYCLPGGNPSRLFVTLLDHEQYPARELVELYHERWELEIAFDEVKTHMLERKECLRSKKPDGVIQELWAQLLSYNLVRREMLLAAQAHGVPPRRISFRSSLIWIRSFFLTTAATGTPGNLPRHLADLRSTLDILILPARRSERRYPRHVKIKMSNYRRKPGKHRVRSPKRSKSQGNCLK